MGEEWFVDPQEPAYKSYSSYLRAGPLPVGSWWPARALMFARHQSQRLFGKRGTRYGFKKGRFSIRSVAGDGYRK